MLYIFVKCTELYKIIFFPILPSEMSLKLNYFNVLYSYLITNI